MPLAPPQQAPLPIRPVAVRPAGPVGAADPHEAAKRMAKAEEERPPLGWVSIPTDEEICLLKRLRRDYEAACAYLELCHNVASRHMDAGVAG